MFFVINLKPIHSLGSNLSNLRNKRRITRKERQKDRMVSSELVEFRIWHSSYIPIFFSMFCMVYFLAYHIIFPNWKPEARSTASSCSISLVHGTPAVILAAYAVWANSDRGFASPNSHVQNLVLDFSVAYFIADLLHYLVFFPRDYLFIGHHIATLFVFTTCRYLAFHGAFALLILLVIAEVTSAVQNIWTLAAIRKAESPLAAKIHNSLSPAFYAFYTLARVIAGPVFFFKMGSFYLSGEATNVISWWVSLSWVVVVGSAISLSTLWVFNNWLELYRERTSITKTRDF